MKISREINGGVTAFELTPAELREAGAEYDLECYSEDVLAKMRELAEFGELPITTKQIGSIPEDTLKEFADAAAGYVDQCLSKNDPYFEAFWLSVEDALKERVNWDEALPRLLGAIA